MSARSQQCWDDFRNRVTELGGEVLEPEWLGKDKPHRCRCAKGHECSPRPGNVQCGKGICRVCAGRDPAAAWSNFRQLVTELGGEVLEPEYLGAIKPHRCRCASGHECSPRPNSVQQGGGLCRTCAGQDPAAAWSNFRQQVTELGGEVLEPEWLGSGTPHRCRCASGHECSPRPAGVQQGRGMCLTCGGKDPAISRDAFYRQIAGLGGEVLESEWLGVGMPHRCRCANGHECNPRPSGVRAGQGICWRCRGWEPDVLYVTRNPATRCIKFGISQRDGRVRLGIHRRGGFTEVLHLFTSLPEGLAAHTEDKIKLALAMAGAEPVRGREYFSEDHLGLIENEIGNWVGAVPAA